MTRTLKPSTVVSCTMRLHRLRSDFQSIADSVILKLWRNMVEQRIGAEPCQRCLLPNARAIARCVSWMMIASTALLWREARSE
jgi:hypothetical protein